MTNLGRQHMHAPSRPCGIDVLAKKNILVKRVKTSLCGMSDRWWAQPGRRSLPTLVPHFLFAMAMIFSKQYVCRDSGLCIRNSLACGRFRERTSSEGHAARERSFCILFCICFVGIGVENVRGSGLAIFGHLVDPAGCHSCCGLLLAFWLAIVSCTRWKTTTRAEREDCALKRFFFRAPQWFVLTLNTVCRTRIPALINGIP